MTTDHQHPEHDDAEVARLLAADAAAPVLRDEFVRALSDRLDSEFASLGRRLSLGASLGANLTNGATNGALANGAARRAEFNGHSGEAAPLPSPQPATGEATEAPAPIVHRSPIWRRAVIAAAVAASLLVAIVAWGPAYGWTAAIRAWVIGIVQSEGEATSGGPQLAPTQELGADGTAEVAAVPEETAAAPVKQTPNALDITSIDVDSTSKRPADKADLEEVKTQTKKSDAPQWVPFDEPLPDDELSRRVDHELAALWETHAIRPAGPASDAEFMRRVYLDLTGRIPTVSEVHEFLNDATPERRERLVDRLLAHRDHATHLAAVWRDILLPEGIDVSRYGGPIEFEIWLAERFQANKPYDQLVRDLLLAEGRVSESGPMLFYAALRLNPEELAGKTSRAFLGVRMECAQCHDHPFDEVSQQDFWSFAAFFARISRPKGRMEVTSPVLAVRDSQQGDVMIPDSEKVVPPRLPLSEIEIDDSPEGPPRRQQLVDWLTSRRNGQFARATVNRVWANLFGRGLVDPVDDMRPANPPLAPELLETLARDFAASGFDLRRLHRALVLTAAYQRSSRSAENDPSRVQFFAQMNIKSITAEQLYDCITTATRQGPSAAAPSEGAGIERFADTNRQAFIAQFRVPAGKVTGYQAGIPQALTMMHGGLIHNATDLATSGLLQSFSAPFFTDQQRLETLFLSTLSRYPEPAEREAMLRHIAAAKGDDQRQQVFGDVLWALLNSGEFTFNH